MAAFSGVGVTQSGPRIATRNCARSAVPTLKSRSFHCVEIGAPLQAASERRSRGEKLGAWRLYCRGGRRRRPDRLRCRYRQSRCHAGQAQDALARLSQLIGIAEQNVSLLKSGKVKGVRFDTLEKICEILDCQPGDILEYRPEETK